MKILLIRNAFAGDFGGAETYALQLAVALREQGHDPIVVSKVPELLSRAHQAGINYASSPWFGWQDWHTLPFVVRPLMTVWYAFVAAWYSWFIVANHVDIVHAQSRDDFIAATWAARLTGRPVIWTDHADLKFVLKPSGINLIRRLVLRTAKRANAIIVVSHSEKQQIESVAAGLPLQVVHNGVFVPNPSPVHHPEQLVIGYCGRLVESKGLGELITAFAKTSPGDTELWLVGEGSDRKRFEDLARNLGVIDRVNFWGYQVEALNYVAAFDIFVNPSYSEGFSLAILEAAMLGLPIIATAVGGTPEIISEETGILVPPRDSEALAQALGDLLDDPKNREKLGKGAARLARKQFDFRKIVADQIIPLYRKSRDAHLA